MKPNLPIGGSGVNKARYKQDRAGDHKSSTKAKADELASEVRIGLSGGGRWIRTSGSGASGEADAILPVKDRPR
jgi:hypothetical protein